MISTILAFLLAPILYVTFLLISFPQEKFLPMEERDLVTEIRSEIDAQSTVNATDIKSFFLFSNTQESFENWRSLNFDQSGQVLSAKKDLKLPGLMKDFCDEAFCYQSRIKFDDIPGLFWKGLMGIEDTRFLNHNGVDFVSIARALLKNINEMRLAQGGSTITQQLVKNVMLSNHKSLWRKLNEVVYATYIETRFEKEQILELYFNEVFWGSLQGIQIKGIRAASIFYFDKKLWDLDPYEVAILISMLKGPGFYSPVKHLDRLKQRTGVVLKSLVDQHLFPDDKRLVWSDSKWLNWQKALLDKNKTRPYFAMATHTFQTGDVEEFEQYIAVSKANEILNNVKDKNKEKNFAVKMLIGKPQGEIGTRFKFYSKFERNLDKAIIDEKHQIGSTIKPIIYRALINHGLSLNDATDTFEIKLQLPSGEWSPRESRPDELNLNTTYEEALHKSMNRPVIKAANKIGFDVIEPDVVEMIPSIKKPLKEFPSQLIGSIELSLNDLFESYVKFLKKDCDGGKQIIIALSDPNKTTIRKVVDWDLRRENFFGKTGTTNNGIDNWFVFYDGKYLGIIWLGFEGGRENVKLDLSGSTTAFKVFNGFAKDRGKRIGDITCF